MRASVSFRVSRWEISFTGICSIETKRITAWIQFHFIPPFRHKIRFENYWILITRETFIIKTRKIYSIRWIEEDSKYPVSLFKVNSWFLNLKMKKRSCLQYIRIYRTYCTHTDITWIYSTPRGINYLNKWKMNADDVDDDEDNDHHIYITFSYTVTLIDWLNFEISLTTSVCIYMYVV